MTMEENFITLAEVHLNIRTRLLDKTFTYKVKTGMSLEKGSRVYVPFGKRRAEGFVTDVYKTDKLESEQKGFEIREIIDVINEEKWHNQRIFALANWLSDFYLCTKTEALRLFVQGSSVVKKNKIAKNEVFKKTVKFSLGTKKEEFVLEKLKKKPAQKRFFEILKEQKEISFEKLNELRITVKRINDAVEDGWAVVSKDRLLRNSYFHLTKDKEKYFELTEEQEKVVDNISNCLIKKKEQCFLLLGITGSGKTQVYIECAKKARSLGKQVLAMVPEIALTGQFVQRFKAVFGEDVAVLHSRLSVGERNDACDKIAFGQANILIGARSAVFAPFSDLGLVIIDEEHEKSYRQDNLPYYHAIDVAKKLVRDNSAVLLLGSATPRLEDYYKTEQGVYRLLKLTKRIGTSVLPEIEVVDMRLELKKGQKGVLSVKLRKALQETIQAGEQAILLLNRRGHSTFVLCRDCGYVVKCDECMLPMVYHLNGQKLRCHYCEKEKEVMNECPSCLGRKIKFFGTGTQKAEEELGKILPNARVLRMDQDTTKGKFGHEKILKAFSCKEYDVLLGTQMVAKGHDIKNVTLVGIISIDTSLQRADFRAAEETFNLITQAAGRAGRGKKKGRVIVQTYNPEHYVIKAGIKQDYEQFFQQELEFRKELFYPPFSKLVTIICIDENESLAWKKACKVKDLLNAGGNFSDCKTEILGPFVGVVSLVRKKFLVRILIKTLNLQKLRDFLKKEGLTGKNDVLIEIEN